MHRHPRCLNKVVGQPITQLGNAQGCKLLSVGTADSIGVTVAAGVSVESGRDVGVGVSIGVGEKETIGVSDSVTVFSGELTCDGLELA